MLKLPLLSINIIHILPLLSYRIFVYLPLLSNKMTFNRHIYRELLAWRSRKKRKPLIIRGARQVGKTTIVNEFAKNYEQYVYLNLEKTSDKKYFNSRTEAKRIIETIFLKKNIKNDYANTLVFIDEIQASPEAIHLLRYLYEDLPELHVITAGSLFEFVLKDVSSFPVGRVEFMYLSPMNFSEFLGAIKHERALEEFNNIPFKNLAQTTLLELFNTYTIIGGMPEIVQEFVRNESIVNLQPIYESLWSTYKNDIEKYAQNSTIRNVLRLVMDTAPEFIDERIKLNNFGRSNYRTREVSEAMTALSKAKILQLVYPNTNLEIPIIRDLKKSPKIQFLDTGLVNYSLKTQSEMIGLNDLSKSYKGAIIPHIVNQELISISSQSEYRPSFWVREKAQASSEVDLVFRHKGLVVPIEIKSGATGTLRSLHEFIDRCPHNFGVRLYAGELSIEAHQTRNGKDFQLLNLPYFLASKLPEYLDWFISK